LLTKNHKKNLFFAFLKPTFGAHPQNYFNACQQT